MNPGTVLVPAIRGACSKGPLPLAERGVGMALPHGSVALPPNASLPLPTTRGTGDKVLAVATPITKRHMTAQTKTTRRPPSAPHAYVVPVVRELPSLPSPALTPQTW
jgi:hypothetical protein